MQRTDTLFAHARARASVHHSRCVPRGAGAPAGGVRVARIGDLLGRRKRDTRRCAESPGEGAHEGGAARGRSELLPQALSLSQEQADGVRTAGEKAIRRRTAAQGEREGDQEGWQVMTLGTMRKGIICFAAACLLSAIASQVAPAASETPWWGLSTGTRPTDLQSGIARDEVQRLTISATKGDVALLEPKRLREVNFGQRSFEELLVAVVP